jgi:recombination protein RecT
MNAPATRENSPVAAFSNFMDKLKPQLALALPKHLTADRMARLALTAFSTNLNLQGCDPKSIAASIMTAGQLGLEPGVNGQGYLIPYKTTCTFVPGWKGLVDLVARSGRGTVYTGVIFRDQQYTFTDGARRDLVIHNETDLDAPEDITHAFAIGWVKDASMPIIELWSVEKIKKHRDKYNKVGGKHYSFRDWEMYCRKIPLLQVLKYMPASIEVANAIAVTHASEAGHGVTIENGIVIEDESTPQDERVECYPDEDFKKNIANWTSLIKSGKKTAENIIAMANSKAPMTDEQKQKIRDITKPVSQDGEMTEEEIAAARAREIAEAGEQS